MLTQSFILTCKRESKQLNYNNKLINKMIMHVEEIKRATNYKMHKQHKEQLPDC
jgi:hypothetical protein